MPKPEGIVNAAHPAFIDQSIDLAIGIHVADEAEVAELTNAETSSRLFAAAVLVLDHQRDVANVEVQRVAVESRKNAGMNSRMSSVR